jgi:plasmid maintenance system antidote protein VapI
MKHTTPHRVLTASDLRAIIARAGVRAYSIAARLEMHPASLSQILNGHRPLGRALVKRIVEAIDWERRNGKSHQKGDRNSLHRKYSAS